MQTGGNYLTIDRNINMISKILKKKRRKKDIESNGMKMMRIEGYNLQPRGGNTFCYCLECSFQISSHISSLNDNMRRRKRTKRKRKKKKEKEERRAEEKH